MEENKDKLTVIVYHRDWELGVCVCVCASDMGAVAVLI